MSILLYLLPAECKQLSVLVHALQLIVVVYRLILCTCADCYLWFVNLLHCLWPCGLVVIVICCSLIATLLLCCTYYHLLFGICDVLYVCYVHCIWLPIHYSVPIVLDLSLTIHLCVHCSWPAMYDVLRRIRFLIVALDSVCFFSCYFCSSITTVTYILLSHYSYVLLCL